MYSVQLKSIDYGISWIQVSISSSGRKLSPPQLLFNVYWQSCPCRVVWPAHEADNSPPSNAKFKNKCSYSPTYFQGTHTHWHTLLLHVLRYRKDFPFTIPICLFQKHEKSFCKMVPISIYKVSKQVPISQFHCASGHDFKTTATFKPVKFRRRPPSYIQVNMMLLM